MGRTVMTASMTVAEPTKYPLFGVMTVSRVVFIHVSACVYAMVRMTFAIPDGLKRRLDGRKDINWREVFREALRARVEALEKMHSRGVV